MDKSTKHSFGTPRALPADIFTPRIIPDGMKEVSKLTLIYTNRTLKSAAFMDKLHRPDFISIALFTEPREVL